jgi:hypothetical protein
MLEGESLMFGDKRHRRGLTLAELLVASTIMVLIAGAMATLAMAVHAANSHCRGQVLAAQHARVALDRIEQALRRAYANEAFPGCLVVSEPVAGDELPQALVVWAPAASPAAPAGLPRISELVLFAPDPAAPHRLLEIRAPTEHDPAPAPDQASSWRTLVDRLRSSQTAEKQRLTDRLRTAPLSGEWDADLLPGQLRGVVRFRRIVAPTEQEWAEYRGGTRSWHDIAWPLDSFRASSGTRVVVCHTELHVVAGNMSSPSSTALPFFGSASVAYELPRN